MSICFKAILAEIKDRADKDTPDLADLIATLEDEDCHIQDIHQHTNEIIDADRYLSAAKTDILRLVAALEAALKVFARFDAYDADSLIGLIIRQGYIDIEAILKGVRNAAPQ